MVKYYGKAVKKIPNKHKGKTYKPTRSGYRMFRHEDGTPYYVWVGKSCDGLSWPSYEGRRKE